MLKVFLVCLVVSCVVVNAAMPMRPIMKIFERAAQMNTPARTRAPNDFCEVLTCSNLNQNCGYNLTAQPYQIPFCLSSYCNNTADPTVGTCIPLLADWASCTDDTQCKVTSSCNNTAATAGVCIPRNSQEPAGGICTTSSNCQYSTSSCSNGICNGVALNGACASGSSNECNPPNVCSSNVCVAPTANGAPCNVAEQLCGPVSYCLPSSVTSTTGTCTAIGTTTAGGICLGQETCPDGTGCYIASGNTAGTCITPPSASSGTSCNTGNSTGCGQYEECQCNYNTGSNGCYLTVYPNPSGYSATITSAINCVSSKCNTASQACITTTCLNSYCALLDTLQDDVFKSYTSYYPQCLINYYQSAVPAENGCTGATATGTGSSSDACVVAASSAAAVGLGLAALLV